MTATIFYGIIINIMVTLYKYTFILFFLYLLSLNLIVFSTTLNPRALINPFNIRTRSASVYYLLEFIFFETGITITRKGKSEIIAHIEQVSKKYHLDPNLIKIVVDVESKYNELAISRSGAMGLMQLMPLTFQDMGYDRPFDYRQNIEAGIKYLSIQIKSFKDLNLALSAYNAGPGTVMALQAIPDFPETKNYVKNILGRYDLAKKNYATEDIVSLDD